MQPSLLTGCLMLLILLALVSSALAADPIADAQALVAALDEPIVLAAVGPDAHKFLEKQLKARVALASEVALVQVPTVGDVESEMRRALDKAAVRCGLRVSASGSSWKSEEYGDCAAQPAQPAAAGVSSGAAPAGTFQLSGPAASVLGELMAMPDHATRTALITAKLGSVGGDADLAGRLGQTLATVSALEARGEQDPTAVRRYLAAALADDPVVRAAAIGAASSGADVPEVTVGSASAASASSASAPANAGQGTLCLARPLRYMAAAVSLNVLVDNKLEPSLRNGKAVVLSLPAGEHQLEVGPQGAGGLNATIDIKAGRTLVFKVAPSMAGFSIQQITLSDSAGSLCN